MPRDPYPPACVLCRDVGFVIVPHPKCVWRGRLVCYPGSRGLYTTAVACTNRVLSPTGFPVQCPPGLSAQGTGVLTWDHYTERIRGLDGATMLAELEAERAELLRRGEPERRLGEAERGAA